MFFFLKKAGNDKYSFQFSKQNLVQFIVSNRKDGIPECPGLTYCLSMLTQILSGPGKVLFSEEGADDFSSQT